MNCILPARFTDGSVLIVVLWATLGLVSVALLFGSSMTMNYRSSDNDLAGRQAAQAIEGAARYVETLLKTPATPGVLPDVSEYLGDTVPVGEATFYLIGRSEDSGNGTTRSFGLVDESAKLCLNIDPTLLSPTQLQAYPAMLKAIPGMPEELADAIIDWQDPDDNVTGSGAESDTYLRFDPAYSCKNGPLESIEELALLNGATRTVLYGEDTNMNGVLDPNENDGSVSDPPDNADGKLDVGILEYVTIFNRESNNQTSTSQTASTTPRIDVSDPQQVRSTLEPLIDEKTTSGRGAAILRKFTPQQKLASVLEFYIVAKTGSDGLSEEEFGKIADEITTSTGAYRYGLLNVNAASEAVLACIPGIGAKAADVLSARLSRPTQDTNIAWLLNVLTDPEAQQAGPFITGRSSQVTADIAAVGRHGRGYRREKIVIDQSTGTPQIVYRRDLSPLGWALGSEIRGELAKLKEGVK